MGRLNRDFQVRFTEAQYDSVIAYAEQIGVTRAEAVRQLVGLGLAQVSAGTPRMRAAQRLRETDEEVSLVARTIEAISAASAVWRATADVKWLERLAALAAAVPNAPIDGQIRAACQAAGISLPPPASVP